MTAEVGAWKSDFENAQELIMDEFLKNSRLHPEECAQFMRTVLFGYPQIRADSYLSYVNALVENYIRKKI
jgi:hypothetical protein